jgi:Glycosyl transferase family 11
VNITTATWELIYSSKKQVTTEFQWKPEIKKLVGKKMGMLRRRYKTIVGVHVRRTDYYTYLNDYYGKFYAADANYYNKTMNYFR